MPLEFDTVAIPVTTGVNLTTPARLLPPGQLLEAENSRFPRGAGATKRRGHTASKVRGTKAIPGGVPTPSFVPPEQGELFTNRAFPAGWVWGWGVDLGTTTQTSALGTSTHPSAGLLFGAVQRDSEQLAWDGFRLFSRTPGQPSGAALPEIPAVMPSLRSGAIAKSNQAQENVQSCDTGRIKMVAWTAAGQVWYTILDSTTQAVIQPVTSMNMVAPQRIRVLNVGNYCHLMAVDSDALLHRVSVSADTPRAFSAVSLGICPTYFDVHKLSEEAWILLRNTNGHDLIVTFHRSNGVGYGDAITLDFPAGVTSLHNVGIAKQLPGTNGYFGIIARAQVAAIYQTIGYVCDLGGGIQTTWVDFGAVALADLPAPVAIAPLAIPGDDGAVFEAYFDLSITGQRMRSVRFQESSLLAQSDQWHLRLASSAFRVGNRTYCWASRSSTYQSSWFLVDFTLGPVGRAEYVTANVNTATNRSITQVNWQGPEPTVFHGALGYKIRTQVDLPENATNAPPVYADPSAKFYTLDMVPPLRAAQAGRSLYFAGAQLWSYDGLELTEAGFHVVPEGVTGAPSGAGSGLLAGQYKWRVDLCYRNAYNEEHRSASLYTNAVTTTAGQNVLLTIPTCLTRRANAYFLIYRNLVAGTQWYLVNSRDPSNAKFLKNDLTVASVTFNDTGAVTDAQLPTQEYHPANGGFNYIDQFSAPACEIIAAGHNRLWLAGGELAPGQVQPSRLFSALDTPSFNSALAQQVDRNVQPITAIGFVGETRAFFRKTQTYVQQGDGPDNSSNGAWEPIREAYADVGAVGPESLGLLSTGLVFQSPAGIRQLSAGGGLQPVGQPVDSFAKGLSITGTLVVGEDQEIRFYHSTGTLVYNYMYNTWSTWTCRAVGATRNPDTGLALLATADAYFWQEMDGLWTDDGHPYRHRIRFGWLRRGDLMDFQRVRRVGALGECDPQLEHRVHVEVFYDEREFAEERFQMDYPDPGSQNTDEFGSATFGAGSFGDDTGEP